jgi:hypothetical protein
VKNPSKIAALPLILRETIARLDAEAERTGVRDGEST